MRAALRHSLLDLCSNVSIYKGLPPDIRALADRAYERWRTDTKQRGLNFECTETEDDIWSVQIGKLNGAFNSLSLRAEWPHRYKYL